MLDPLEGLGVSSGARVLALGGAAEDECRNASGLWVTTAATEQLSEIPAGSFDAVVAVGFLELEEWDRWVLQQMHRALKDGGRLVLTVPNMLALCSADDVRGLAARVWMHAARAGAKLLRRSPRPPPSFTERRYLRGRLRGMLQELGFSISSWSADGLGPFAPLARVAPGFAGRWSSRHVITCEKRPGYFGLPDARRYPEVAEHRRAYEVAHRSYLGVRDRWLERHPHLAPEASRPLDVTLHAGRDVLVLAPHPDDEIIGCGGTLIRLIAAGARVTIIQATDGSASLALRDAPEPSRSTTRLEEAGAVGEALGAAQVILWREDNRAFRYRDDLVARLRDDLEARKPDLVFTPFVTDLHEDHLMLNRILASALETAAIDRAATSVLGYEVWSLVPANRYGDITDVAARRDELLLLYPTAMKVDDFVHLCAHRNYYNAYSFMGREGYAEAFYETRASDFAALLKTVESPNG